MKKFFLSNSHIFLFIFICLFVTYPLLHGGFFPTMDDVQVVRVDVMTRELLSGQFPVRLISNFGYGAGYLLFNFYGTLPYYIGAFFHLFGVSLVRSTKFVFIVGYIFGAWGIYRLVRVYADKITATIASLLFLTASYLNYDVYTRGSLGEFFGFVSIPALFWAFLRLQKQRKKVDILIASLMYGISIISHPLTAVMGTVFLVIFIFILLKEKQQLFAALVAWILGLGLSAFSWIPVAFEQKYLSLTTNSFETRQYASNFFTPLQLGGLEKIAWGIKPPLLGAGLFLGALVGIFFLFRKNVQHKRIGVFALIAFIVSFFMISSLSKSLWDASPYVRLVQFPWRYLVITTVAAILLISVFLSDIKSTLLKIILGIVLLFPSVTLQYSYLRPTMYNYIAIYTADDTCNTSTWAQEYLPKWVHSCITKDTHLPFLQSSSHTLITHVSQERFGRFITFDVIGSTSKIILKKYYFPGWVAYVDRKNSTVYPSTKYGLVTFHVPSGNHHITILFENTWDRTIANILSAVSVLVGLTILTFALKKKK